VAAEVFFEDCHRMSFEDFKESVARHRRKSVYFPAPADILREYALIITARRNDVKALPPVQNLSEEQIALNLEKIKELRKSLKIGSRG
jgi:hypothetical protein